MYMYICARSVNYHNAWRKVIVLPYLTNGGKVKRNLFKITLLVNGRDKIQTWAV